MPRASARVNGCPENSIFVPVCRKGDHCSRMTLSHLRPHGERRFLEGVAIEPIGPESIRLPPHINQRTVLRAVPISQAGQLRTGCLEMLDRLAVAQVAHVTGID